MLRADFYARTDNSAPTPSSNATAYVTATISRTSSTAVHTAFSIGPIRSHRHRRYRQEKRWGPIDICLPPRWQIRGVCDCFARRAVYRFTVYIIMIVMTLDSETNTMKNLSVIPLDLSRNSYLQPKLHVAHVSYQN